MVVCAYGSIRHRLHGGAAFLRGTILKTGEYETQTHRLHIHPMHMGRGAKPAGAYCNAAAGQSEAPGFYRCAVLTEYDIDSVPKYMRWLGCVSLGMFIFVGTHKDTSRERAREIASHEYGHTLQSLLLGPLYLIAVGAPSFIWCRHYGRHRQEYAARGISYYSRYPEKQATALGLKAERRKI